MRWRPKALDAAPDDSREWLIWSMYHDCWHRRSEQGGANGYATHILDAGLFETRKARQYHDGVRNRAIHVSRRIADINGAYDKAAEIHSTALANVSAFRAALLTERSKATGGEGA